MTKKLLLAIFFSLAMTVAAQAQFSDNGVKISGTIGKGYVTRGGTTKATVVLEIPEGLHVNSNRPRGEFLIPTKVKASGLNVTIGKITYPPGKDRKFPFSEESLNVYENRPSFSFIVSVPKNYRGKTVTINAVVDYQACTEEVCYPPNKKKLTLTAKVR
jgi:thiol:disulfide interchange protein DsbD